MTYADNFNLRTSSINGNSIASAVDGLVSDIQTDTSTALINTTSTSSVDYTGESISVTINSGEKVLILAQINVSASASGIKIIMDVTEDGSIITSSVGGFWLSARNDVNGVDGTISISAYSAPAAGSHTYKIKWKTASGTAYSAGARLTVLVSQA